MRTFLFAAVTALLVPVARAEESRFAVIDLSSADAHNDALVAAVEKEVARLRPGARPIEDAALRRLLANGEGPAAAAVRLTREARERRAAGDCEGAVDRARQAEALTLSSVPLDDERELLRWIYVTLVSCEHERGKAAERDLAARRLRDLVSLPPPGMDKPEQKELWEKHVANATPGPPATEMHIDSEPANAQISVNFHGEGVTPRTLKVPRGTVYVEVQKDGFRKAFRKLEVGAQPVRTAFRLIERTHDRSDQALAALGVLRQTELTARAQTLSRLAQLVRADTLVVLQVAGDRVKIWFFDAERGAVSGDVISSPFDAQTGRIAALAERPTPEAPRPPAAPGILAPTTPGSPSQPRTDVVKPAEGLPEAEAQQKAAATRRRRERPGGPWWGWVIAGVIGASLVAYIYFDRPQTKDTLAVRAFWQPPGP